MSWSGAHLVATKEGVCISGKKTETICMISVPAHRSGLVSKWLKDETVNVLGWPGNSQDFNPIKNAWNHMKNLVSQTHCVCVEVMVETLIRDSMDLEYSTKLGVSMKSRLEKVTATKDHMTKY